MAVESSECDMAAAVDAFHYPKDLIFSFYGDTKLRVRAGCHDIFMGVSFDAGVYPEQSIDMSVCFGSQICQQYSFIFVVYDYSAASVFQCQLEFFSRFVVSMKIYVFHREA